ncbi:MAG: alpha/beta hydrolase [Christensenellaceae bacterium]|jgi:pimeloyl-ACP methyl ester carboxylesterase|nr:alpha/beta hydrolase [Christensenellaceae bacterium]
MMRKNYRLIGTASLIALLFFVFIAATLVLNPKTSVADDATVITYYTGRDGGSRTSAALKTAISNNSVVATRPTVTVITHGMGGEASHWTNDLEKLAYDEASVVEQIRAAEPGNVEVYWAKSYGETAVNSTKYNFELRPLETTGYVVGDDAEGRSRSIQRLDAGSAGKHIVIIWESFYPNDTHMVSYYEFAYIVDLVLYDIKQINGGVNPVVNLIGHSRGGNTNVLYASNHPYNVAKVFSLGSPYNGSKSLAVLVSVIDALGAEGLEGLGINLEMANLDSMHEGAYGDISDPVLAETMKNGWNAAVALNPNLRIYAVAGITDMSFWKGLISFAKLANKAFFPEENARIAESPEALLALLHGHESEVKKQFGFTVKGLRSLFEFDSPADNYADYLTLLTSVLGEKRADAINDLIASAGDADDEFIYAVVLTAVTSLFPDFSELGLPDLGTYLGIADVAFTALQAVPYLKTVGLIGGLFALIVAPETVETAISAVGNIGGVLLGYLFSDSFKYGDVLDKVTDFASDLVFKADSPLSKSFLDRLLIFNNELILLNDLFVDYDSQIATGYDNVTPYIRLFTDKDVIMNRVSMQNVAIPIPHNLEARDPKIIAYILSNIDIAY